VHWTYFVLILNGYSLSNSHENIESPDAINIIFPLIIFNSLTGQSTILKLQMSSFFEISNV